MPSGRLLDTAGSSSIATSCTSFTPGARSRHRKARPFTFRELAARTRSLGHGVLIGWRREGDVKPFVLNPKPIEDERLAKSLPEHERNRTKDTKDWWHPTDQLIVIRRSQDAEVATMSRASAASYRIDLGHV